VKGKVSASDLDSTAKRADELNTEISAAAKKALEENEGNALALKDALKQVEANGRQQLDAEFATLRDESVTWRCTVREVSDTFAQGVYAIHLEPASAILIVDFNGNVAMPHAEKWLLRSPVHMPEGLVKSLRPGDKLLIKGTVSDVRVESSVFFGFNPDGPLVVMITLRDVRAESLRENVRGGGGTGVREPPGETGGRLPDQGKGSATTPQPKMDDPGEAMKKQEKKKAARNAATRKTARGGR
jgi:hypothetical protein